MFELGLLVIFIGVIAAETFFFRADRSLHQSDALDLRGSRSSAEQRIAGTQELRRRVARAGEYIQ